MSADTAGVTISRFSSETKGQKQILQGTVIVFVLQIKWFTANNIPFGSSKTTCSISTTSCRVSKLKGNPLTF